jgi:16S rRNA (cytidine1402-2'-O)-methyltransferase
MIDGTKKQRIKGTLHLIPTPIGTNNDGWLPYIAAIVQQIPYFIVENERTAHRFLLSVLSSEQLATRRFAILDEHTPTRDIPSLLEPILAGQPGALLSEAGTPCLADPGAPLVAEAHRKMVRVIPHPGPSSIIQSLIASGLQGQRFMFAGYLPVKEPECLRRLAFLEQLSRRENMSIGFIETPYRAQRLFNLLISKLSDTCMLSLATNLMCADEYIFTTTVSEWKKKEKSLSKNPAVFWIQAQPAQKTQKGRFMGVS